MKILMINKFLFPHGGSETYLFKLGEYLEKQGHEVQYFGMEHEGRRVGNRVNAYTADMDFHKGSVWGKLAYPVKTVYSREARNKIRHVLEDFRPEVCHLNNFNYQLTPSIILEIVRWRKEAGRGCRIVYTAHDYQLICPNHLLHNPDTHENCGKCTGGRYGNCVKGRCIHGSLAMSMVGAAEAAFWKRLGTYRYIDRVICPSEFLKAKMDTDSVFAGRTVVMHNFVNRVDDGGGEKKDYVLYFGRYSGEKGIDTLLEACRNLPDIRFVFAGTGPLEEKINTLPNAENVGFRTGQALVTLIREARFCVCPSENFENCPFSVLESQTCGTPVLGADIGGIPELIEAGRTGELFESGNVADLEEKIRGLWEDGDLLEKYAQNCRTKHFDTVEEYSRKLMEIYGKG